MIIYNFNTSFKLMDFVNNIIMIKEKFDNAKSKLILLDYDGTLVEFAAKPENAMPSEKVLQLLSRLNSTPDTKLVIVSGRGYRDLDRFMGHLPIVMIAEHGAMIKLNGQWKNLYKYSGSWKSVVFPVLNRFTISTPNSFVEEKEFSFVWHYRNVSESVGHVTSRNLLQVLANSVASLGLKVIDGDKVIEIISDKIGKGNAVKELMKDEKFDFIISIGDDKTDEEMFLQLSDNRVASTIKVGNGPTAAKHTLENVDHVLLFLEQLVEPGVN
jgi:trehalose 6-phosphate synthase/phosphatase